ncbi:MCE family protein [Nocardioides sp. TF02-7]|uniref:MCE family protein n=1 Tax=Nocardioides sp. TF02-7 TaxID=2917724 RepID=UPI001F05DB0F|nr:MCE family protein [Nocardioides sp. TF02-7]UMG92310.1 MCE family protein [Nocardioides sp. TF02-7]
MTTKLTQVWDRIDRRVVALVVVLVAAAAVLNVASTPAEHRTVVAHFPRAVSVYEGTDVRILGVNVGEVTSVVPAGNSVRVEMEYDAGYDVPADAKAVIVTPTLVADRFVQLTPVYQGGPVLADGAEIALPDTGVPVELDRIYGSLQALTRALGPNGVNKDGSLDNLLEAGTEALEGQGAAGNEMIRELALAAETFGEGAGPLFRTVTHLAEFTGTLAQNDTLVRAFMKDLAGVSRTLAAESDELQRAVAAVARAVGSVESFVRDNRKALSRDVRQLTTVVRAIASEKDNIRKALEIGPTALDTLHLGFDHTSGTQNSRLGVAGMIWSADALLCGIIQQHPAMPRPLKDLACDLIAQLVAPLVDNLPFIPPEYDQFLPKPSLDEQEGDGHRAVAGERVLRHRRRAVDGRVAGRCVVSRWTRWRTCSVAAAAGAVLLSGCDFDGAYDLPLPGSPVDADDAYEVTAAFEDVLNVVPRSPVMVDDVVVGEVTEVERVGWHAEVTLRIRDDVVLPDNAIADIRQVSLLGEKYVALEEPTEQEPIGRLEQGEHIDLAVTGRNPEVEEVLGALSFLLSGGGVAQLGTITREANLVMSGREDRLKALLGSLEGVVGTLDQQKADIINALDSLNNLAATLNAEKDTIGDALDAIGPAVDVLADQHDELIDMLGALDRLGRVGTRVINASKEDMLAMLEHLHPVLTKLREADHKLGPGVNLLVSFPFPKAANSIVQGDYADSIGQIDVDFANLFKNLGLPEINLPDPGEILDQVQRCLRSGSLVSSACIKVLRDVNLVADLQRQCQQARHPQQPGVPAADRSAGPRPREPPGAGTPDRQAQRADRRGQRAAREPGGRTTPAAGHRHRRGRSRVSRGVRIRLIAFVALSAVGITYITATYLGLVDRITGRGITVTATLPGSGGLFEGSEVTYRGVKIGKVTSMEPTEDGIVLELSLEHDTRLPVDSAMYVHNLSAVGEQYLDFQPAEDEGPYAEDGTVFRGDGSSLPVDEGDLLVDIDDFVGSVDKRNLQVVVKELGVMFGDTGRELQAMLDHGRVFIEEASAHTDETVALLENGLTVLRTQQGQKENIRSFARDLARLTGGTPGQRPRPPPGAQQHPRCGRRAAGAARGPRADAPRAARRPDHRRPDRAGQPRGRRAAARALPDPDRGRPDRQHPGRVGATSTCSSTTASRHAPGATSRATSGARRTT